MHFFQWQNAGQRKRCSTPVEELQFPPLRLNGDVLRVTDVVWRAGSLGRAGGGHGEHEKFSRGLADCVQVVAVIPEELIHRAVREKAGMVGGGATAIEEA